MPNMPHVNLIPVIVSGTMIGVALPDAEYGKLMIAEPNLKDKPKIERTVRAKG